MDYSALILEIMPLAISIVTGLILTWGVYIGVWFDRLLRMQHLDARRHADQFCLACIWASNATIFALGVILPVCVPSIGQVVSDAVMVLNIFYGVFLISCSIGIYKWKRAERGDERTHHA